MKLPVKNCGFQCYLGLPEGITGVVEYNLQCLFVMVRRTIHFGSHSQSMASCEIEVDGGFNVKDFPLLRGPHPGWVLSQH